MMLVVDAPSTLVAAQLETALAPVAEQFELVLVVREIDDGVPASPTGDPWTVSVYGADRPGIVHRVASALADLGVNIVDLSTRSVSGGAYVLLLELSLPTYERVRQNPRRFLLAPGHEVPEVEVVVERAEAYVVVEKRGEAGDLAERLDPRS